MQGDSPRQSQILHLQDHDCLLREQLVWQNHPGTPLRLGSILYLLQPETTTGAGEESDLLARSQQAQSGQCV